MNETAVSIRGLTKAFQGREVAMLYFTAVI